MFIPGYVNDRKLLKQSKLLKNIKRKPCTNKGYID